MSGTATAAMSRLGISHPIVQGPFGGGLSSVKLAATVSSLGGLGSYGAHALAPSEIERVTRELHAATSNPFAVNLWVSDHDPAAAGFSHARYEQAWRLFAPYFAELGVAKPEWPERTHPHYAEQVEAMLEARPPVFSFVFGVPTPKVLAACRARAIVTIGTATTIAEAQALESAGVDLIVATGFEAGGHRPAFLAEPEAALTGTFVLTQLIASRVRTPVIAAGGICDAKGITAALALGAQGAQIGTAFLACEESAAPALHRDVLFSAEANPTALTRSFTGRLARGVRNRWVIEMAAHASELAPFPVQSWFVAQLRAPAIAAGRTDLISLWCGQIAPNLEHRTAPALMQALVHGLDSVLPTRPRSTT